MRTFILLLFLFFFGSLSAQEVRDTILRPCPVYITDTASSNNFFIEGLPVTLKVYRVRGELTIQFEQRDQFFTIFFHIKRLRNKTYKLESGSGKRKEVEAAYSFRSGDQVSSISVSDGKLVVSFDKEKNMWHMNITGTIRNMVERSVTYYLVKSDFYIM